MFSTFIKEPEQKDFLVGRLAKKYITIYFSFMVESVKSKTVQYLFSHNTTLSRW